MQKKMGILNTLPEGGYGNSKKNYEHLWLIDGHF